MVYLSFKIKKSLDVFCGDIDEMEDYFLLLNCKQGLVN